MAACIYSAFVTPWWANLISVAVGALVGGLASLWGVKIVQDRTDLREQRRIDIENKREQRKIESEKPSRLRPDRVSLLYDIGILLHDLDRTLEVLFDRSENDQSYDWEAVAADAASYASTTRKMDIRVRLLFQNDDLVNEWNSFHEALLRLDQVVEFGNQMVAPGK
jgi:hypothetical protein